jgi:two-component system OmpR family sensor kinase
MKKLSFSLVGFLLVSIIMLGWGADVLFDRFFSRDSQEPISYYQTLGQQLASALNQQPEPEAFVQAWHLSDSENFLTLLDDSQLPLPEALKDSMTAGQPLALDSDIGLTLYYWLETHQKILAFSPEEFSEPETVSLAPFFLTAAYYISLLLLLALWLVPLLNSLRELSKNSKAYGLGDFSTRIRPKKFTYIDDIENAFNKMADQIEMLVNDNKLISSAVSHDLRTPLARLRFGIDMLSDSEDPAERSKYQEHLSNDIDEMQTLVEALLHYAKLDQTLISLEKTPVNVDDILSTFQKNHPDGVVSFENHSKQQSLVLGHATYLKMLFHNILNNGLTHGDHSVLVTTGVNKGQLIVSIHDDGTGIPEALRERLFKPFVRGEHSSNTQGYGMGLAIAKRIAQWHQGDIEIFDSNRLKGAEFLIRLPLV